jgi:hypothetical protein
MILNGVICVLNAIMLPCGKKNDISNYCRLFYGLALLWRKKIQDNFDFFDMEFRFGIV